MTADDPMLRLEIPMKSDEEHDNADGNEGGAEWLAHSAIDQYIARKRAQNIVVFRSLTWGLRNME